ncbi:hypothetical protein N431DRAFT_432220 [Stipitochalara longipes BDJ]|nr:hypothetical protein N431DRAFT_432220 [Stipitochalara longipes BDJ]
MFLSYLAPLLLSASAASAACYGIDSSLVTNPDAAPCNSAQGSISMCCDSNRGASSLYTPDTCLSNGLCQNIFTNETTGKPDTNYWREGCSDRGWNSQYCLTGVCTGSSDVDSNGNAEMTPCDGTSTSATWCCGTHNTNCCGTGQAIVLAAVLGSASSSSISTSATPYPSTSTSQSGASFTPTPTPSPSPTSLPSSGLSTGAKAGIGIGSVALAALVAGAILLFFFKRKGSRRGGVDGIAATDAAGYYGSGYHDVPKTEQQDVPLYQHQLFEMRGDGENGAGHQVERGELP